MDFIQRKGGFNQMRRFPPVPFAGNPFYQLMPSLNQPHSLVYPKSVASFEPSYSQHHSCMCITKAYLDLNNLMRTLWEQHVAWTRMLIISIAAGLPDEELVTKRLLRNAVDMANVMKSFYGDAIASTFEALFRDHFIFAAQLVKAAKADDNRAAVETEKNWYENANEIAAFLQRVNPYWSEEAFRAMLHEHLALTKTEAVNRLTGYFAVDIATFDKVKRQALEMADAFTMGIVRQFPNYFICE
ncbi:LysM peptidoglycan-binding domain-containing protein [Brevibacillus invocatus]|nr:LysM peptidoglycan-binding domain-containing protein [Brevibacillus invocatus]